jgi:hypothetical protein
MTPITSLATWQWRAKVPLIGNGKFPTMCGEGNSLNKISAGGLKTAALMGWRFLFFREFLMH